MLALCTQAGLSSASEVIRHTCAIRIRLLLLLLYLLSFAVSRVKRAQAAGGC